MSGGVRGLRSSSCDGNGWAVGIVDVMYYSIPERVLIQRH